MTTQKKILDLTGTQYLVQKVKSAINDVDSSLSTHIADTDIHVTTADKTKWNTNTYVFRYSSTALTASSTNSNTLLDNTDNLKVGDKVIDSNGVLFSITAIDTQNSTFTIGTALIDLALDANVVHTSGDETITGTKTFENVNIQLKSTSAEYSVSGGYKSVSFHDKNLLELSKTRLGVYSSGLSYIKQTILGYDSNNQQVDTTITFSWSSLTKPFLRADSDNLVSLGTSGNRWKDVYATNYYYGSNNVEFSTKFVTTDTAQTISGAKTFTDNNMIKTSSPKVLLINTSQTGNTAPSSNTASFLRFDGGTVNNFGGVQCEFLTTGENRLTNYVNDITKAKVNTIQQRANSTTAMTVFNADLLTPASDGVTALGSSSKRWSDVQTYKINALEPSALSLPSNTGYVDISSYFTNTGDGQTNSYTASANGWIYLNVTAKTLIMQIRDSNNNVVYADMCNRSSDGTIYMTIPIGSGNKLLTQWFTSSSVTVTTARFIPCQGNV